MGCGMEIKSEIKMPDIGLSYNEYCQAITDMYLDDKEFSRTEKHEDCAKELPYVGEISPNVDQRFRCKIGDHVWLNRELFDDEWIVTEILITNYDVMYRLRYLQGLMIMNVYGSQYGRFWAKDKEEFTK